MLGASSSAPTTSCGRRSGSAGAGVSRRSCRGPRGVYTGVWDKDLPWETVIRDSSRDRNYWQENVVDLCKHLGGSANN